MSLLTECAPSRWAGFLSISADALPTRSGDDADLFVGENKSVTITLPNGTETRFRDVVVLGELVIQSSDPANNVKSKLIARDFFCATKSSLSDLNFQCRNIYLFKNAETFRSELKELFLEWVGIQRESVERIGLKSILV